ncbi:hypothetical protein FG379_000529 [Cryptosporidium bovis]|uniref:uncharacterized protein n=1 Tax=Cryptosporidium bovis TaxID=310047 RepID=UPI00351A91F1|nr:hypothetical protein FG379_000529 [Cryptosporidium bovis]
MRCSPPVSSDRNTSIEKGTRSNNSPSNKDDKSFKNCSIGAGAGTAIEGIRKSESDKGFGAPIENNTYENVRKMISQLSIIGAATLENSGIPINERYVRSFKLNIK